jgi:hypothetical protein
MEVMLDPVSRKLAAAPIEDEEVGEVEEQAVAEAREWRQHNKPIVHEDVLGEFGLTMADCCTGLPDSFQSEKVIRNSCGMLIRSSFGTGKTLTDRRNFSLLVYADLISVHTRSR